MSIDMKQFHGVFFDESQEHLDNMEQELMALDLSNPNSEQLNSIFRAAHSIKGGSGIFGFDALTGLTHIMESLLDKARQGTASLSDATVNVLLETIDLLKVILGQYKSNDTVNHESVEQGITRLEAVIDEKAPAINNTDDIEGFGFFDDEPEESAQAQETEEEQGFGFFETPPVTSDADSKGYGLFDESDVIKAQIDPDTKKLTPETIEVSSRRVKEAATSDKQKATSETTSIRVDTGKIDSLVNLVGELVITQSMLAMIGSEVIGPIEDKLQSALVELQRNTREIQESVMSMRMLPMSMAFNRFPRVVRDLSNKLDKKVDLKIEGGNTEIDKGMIEKLVDPLTHLVRNSIDHGIETMEERNNAGKPENGTVILRAEQRGGSIEISITDDGAGLDRDRILAKAAENGLKYDPDISDAEVWELIMAAGFSTADEVTDVSGRGVGMDVVKRNIEAIDGRIEIESSPGKGSAFHIHLPLTLAIVDGMCVSVANQIFVVPLVNIVESIQPSLEQVKVISNERLLWIREQYWPLIELHAVMEVDGALTEPNKAIVVLIESSKKRFALLVDSLVGQQQVVIKSLEKHYKRVAGVAGATIMGDGGVAMILDVESLADLSKPLKA
ncbi:chemotaxis protein CheA [Shewanella sp. TC10]|uniref:chemotaxis protein CheA n=1 Tax=Shewanella sp. TC10 TaxID=1419739 RepID=UPI00129E5084|nr:chemotaxis protein CheW [Shewanella sp. TC10]